MTKDARRRSTDAHEDVVTFWNSQASGFDDEPDHGLKDPRVRDAWRTLLAGALPTPPAKVVDFGCGTGSLTVLLSECGYDLTGIDSSGAMVSAARRKASEAHAAVTIEVGDVSSPNVAPQSVDAVLARHVVWALPDPETAIRRWSACLRPAGVMVLIEGRWCTGTGIGSDALSAIVSPMAAVTDVVELRDAALWGRPIDDERYLLRAVV